MLVSENGEVVVMYMDCSMEGTDVSGLLRVLHGESSKRLAPPRNTKDTAESAVLHGQTFEDGLGSRSAHHKASSCSTVAAFKASCNS